DLSAYRRLPDLDTLRFLRVDRVDRFEIVTPGTGVSVALLPYFVHAGAPHFLLYTEVRPAALERRARQPLYDLPVPVRYVNAGACFAPPGAIAPARLLAPLQVLSVEPLGPPAEPAVAVSTEVRHRFACEIAPTELPPGAIVVAAPELAAAVAQGTI